MHAWVVMYVDASYDACHKVGEVDITSDIFERINQHLGILSFFALYSGCGIIIMVFGDK